MVSSPKAVAIWAADQTAAAERRKPLRESGSCMGEEPQYHTENQSIRGLRFLRSPLFMEGSCILFPKRCASRSRP